MNHTTAGWASSRFTMPDNLWLAGISLVLLVTLLPFSSYIVSLPFIQAEWHMNNTQAAMVFSSYLLGNALAALLLVPLTDKLPPQRVYLGGVIVLTVSNLLFPLLAWNIWTGSALRVLAGAGHIAAYIPGVQLVAKRFSGKRRGTAVGVFVAAGYAGTTLSYTFMGVLLNWVNGWRSAYLITACLGLSALILLAFLRVATEESGGATPPSDGVPLSGGVSLSGGVTARKGVINLGVLKNRAVALVIVAYTLHTAELYIARLWFPSLLSESFVRRGMSAFEATTLAATLAGFMFMMGIAGVFSGGFISDQLGRSRGAALIFTVSGLCSFAAGWLLEAPGFLLITLGFVYGFATAADSAIYSTAVTELAPANRVGSTQAVQSFIGFAVGAILPVVAGSILDVVQAAAGWQLAFSFNGVLAIIGVAALLWLRRLPEATEMAAGKG